MKPDLMPAPWRRLLRAVATGLLSAGACLSAAAADFSVSPIRVDLKPGTLSETIVVTNDGTARLRVSIKLFEWTQDAQGKDIYTDSSDLVYFPRQMDIEVGAKRLVRVGAKAPAGVTERAYRLFVEEEPDLASDKNQVAFYFRFGVPVFLPPAAGKPLADVSEAKLEKGKLSVNVANRGNQHFRLTKVSVTGEGGTFSRDMAGWYSLAGTQRAYSFDIPRDICPRLTALTVLLEGEGEGLRFERKIQVQPASCA